MAKASPEAASIERLARRYAGTADDYVLARAWFGEAAFKAALTQAPPGALDKRSWAFWHRLPMRPFPKRAFR